MPEQFTATLEFVPGHAADTCPMRLGGQVKLTNCSEAPSPYAYSNEVIMMLHSTSLASTVPAVFDITGAARSIYSDFYLPFEAFITAGVIYLALTFTLVGFFKLAENHWLAYLRPQKH